MLKPLARLPHQAGAVSIASHEPTQAQKVEGDHAVGVQIDGDSNSVTIFSGGSKLVLDQPHKRRGSGAPANERQLLLTEWRATSLVGRDDELATLAVWRDSDVPIAVRCITGRAGSGKTRLAIEACEQAEAHGWVAGFVSGHELRRFHAAQNLAQWRSPKDTLVAVDDAAVSAAILKDWFTALARRQAKPDDGRLRILLLERHADPDSDYGWWAELRRNDSLAQAGAGDLIGAERPVPLPAVAQGGERRALLAEAMRLAAAFLRKSAPALPPAGANPDFDRRLADDRLENEPLFLLMAGIVAADRGAPAALALGRIDLAREMAVMERARLARLGASRGLPADGDLIAHLAACATLQRGCDFGAAKAMVAEEVAAMGFAPALSDERLVDLLAEALPSPGRDGLDRVRPDLIGETFVVREVTGPRSRIDVDRLAVVERARRRDEASTLETLVLTAQDLAAGAADHPAVRWLAELASRTDDVAALMRLADAIPHSTLALRELGAHVSGRIGDVLRHQPGSQTDPHLAMSLNNLASFLSDLGQREGALAAVSEAAELYRILAAARPDDFNPKLAAALNNLGVSLSDLGQHEAAFDAAREAVDLRRTLAMARPDVFAPDFAASLNNLAAFLSRLGQREDALAAAREAVDLCRALAGARPDVYKPNLAMSLNNVASFLSELGQDEAALAAAGEAVDLYRDLAAARADAFNPDLAASLTNLANRLGELGQSEAALVAAREAVELRRALAAARPDAFNPNLAMSLHNLANCLGEVGQSEAALAAAREAVDLYRTLAAARPDAFNPNLAKSLTNLAGLLGRLGQSEAALAATQEAVDLFRALAAARPRAFNPHLALSLNNLANRLRDLGQGEAALAAAQEAVDLRRAHAAGQPNAFNPDLAMSLSVLGDMLEMNRQLVPAVGMDHEAVATLAPLFLASPARFARPMSAYVGDYSRRAEAAGIEPDQALLAPIVAKLQELQEGSNDAD